MSKKRMRQKRATLACMGVLTVTAALAFATVNSRVKDFEAREEARMVEPVQTITVAAKVQQAEPKSVLFDVPLSEDLQLHIMAECEKREVDPAVIIAMIERESQYTETAIGDNGNSYGLMQIQKRYHAERMERLGVTELLDPFQNVVVGIDFIAELIDCYGGNVEMALTAYNMGESGAKQNCFDKGIYSSEYSKAVIATWEELNSTPF